MIPSRFPALRAFACLVAFSGLFAGTSSAQLIVLPLGDSITYGFLSFAQPSSAGYRYQLYQDLGGNPSNVTYLGGQSSNGTVGQPQLPGSETANEGHNGYTIEGVDAELTANNNTQPGRSDSNNGGYWLTSGTPGGTPLNPQVVLLDVGTNDATDNEDAATMNAQIVQLMSDLKTALPNAQFLVGNLTPRLDNPAYEAVEEQFNAALPAEIAAQGANFHFVDIHAAVSSSNINVNDGVGGQHPDAAGYAQMGDAWYGALVANGLVAAPEPSTYALFGLGFMGLLITGRLRKARA